MSTFSDYVGRVRRGGYGRGARVLTRTTIADPIIIGCFLVFLAGLRHLIRQARPDYEWPATLVFAVGVALSTLRAAIPTR